MSANPIKTRKRKNNLMKKLSFLKGRPYIVVIGVAIIGLITLGISFAATTGDTIKPSAPANFASGTTTITTVDLSWSASTDNVGVDHYLVYRDGNPVYADPSNPKKGTTTATNYTDHDLWPHSTHTYYVTAFDAAGNESAQAPIITAFTKADTTGPDAPTGLVAAFTVKDPNNTNNPSVKLTWNATKDNYCVNHYDIYRDLAKIARVPATSDPNVPCPQQIPLTYTDMTVGANKTVKYLVQGVDPTGNTSNSSNQVQLTTDTMPPTAATNLYVTRTNEFSVGIAWTAATDNYGVTSYDIYRNNLFLANQSAATGTSYSSEGLQPCTAYTYKVVAKDAVGNVAPDSNVVPATTTAGSGTCDDTAPSVPSNLKGTAISPTQVNLTWGASKDDKGVAGYNIYLHGSSDVFATVTKLSWGQSGLAPGSTNYYTVRAFDTKGQLSEGSTVTVVTPASTSSGALKGKVSSATGIIQGASVKIIELNSTKTTNQTGVYNFASVAPGTYTVQYSATGYVTRTVTLTITKDVLLTKNVTLSK